MRRERYSANMNVSDTVDRFEVLLGSGRGLGRGLPLQTRELQLNTSTGHRESLRLTARFIRRGDLEGSTQCPRTEPAPTVEFWHERPGQPAALIFSDSAVRIVTRQQHLTRYHVTKHPAHQSERVLDGADLARLRRWADILLDQILPSQPFS
jgi:hypothetical protein